MTQSPSSALHGFRFKGYLGISNPGAETFQPCLTNLFQHGKVAIMQSQPCNKNMMQPFARKTVKAILGLKYVLNIYIYVIIKINICLNGLNGLNCFWKGKTTSTTLKVNMTQALNIAPARQVAAFLPPTSPPRARPDAAPTRRTAAPSVGSAPAQAIGRPLEGSCTCKPSPKSPKMGGL